MVSVMWSILWFALCLLLAFSGLVMIPLGLPGTFVIVGSSAAYGALTGWSLMPMSVVFWLLGIALFAEAAEFLLGLVGAKREGGSKYSMAGAFFGGLIGAVVGTPLPLIGNVIGAFVGAFVGAGVIELLVTKRPDRAARVGWGALVGRVVSSIFKVSLSIGMIAYFAFHALPVAL